jgi:hypothetical protein
MSPTISPTIFNEYYDTNQEKCYIAETQLIKAQGYGLGTQYKWSEWLSLGGQLALADYGDAKIRNDLLKRNL